jgi:hypothetical protein
MLKKLFGAAVVAFLFSGLAAQAATIQVSGGSGGLITDFGDRAFQIDNAAGDYNLEVTGAGDVGIDFDLIASPSFTVGNFLVSIAGTGFLVSGTVDMINAQQSFPRDFDGWLLHSKRTYSFQLRPTRRELHADY